MPGATHEVIEGTWDEIAAQAPRLRGHRLVVVVLPDPDPRHAAVSEKPIRPGMFPQLAALTDEDFKAAEYRAESIAYLTADGNITASGLVPVVW